MAKLRAAEQEEDDALFALYDEERAAEEALAQAKQTERRRTIAVILAEPPPAGPNSEQALEALAAVKRLIASALGRKTAIREEVEKAEAQLTQLGYRQRDAIAALVAADPALERLMALYDEARGVAAECAAALDLIGKTRLPSHLQHWEAINRPTLPPEVSIVEPWRVALGRLEAGEVDTALPVVPGAG